MLRKTLSNGVEMPIFNYGVFQTPPEETERCVTEAPDVDYWLIDTAQAYDNEEGVGATVRASGIPREEVFITSEIWVANMNYKWAAAPVDKSLRKLDTDYIDLMLLHQVTGGYPGTYRVMENVYKAGKLRAIGVSNFYPEYLVDVALLAEIPSAINQTEAHPPRQQDAAREVMTEFGMAHEAWAPSAEGQNNISTSPVLVGVGEKYGKKPGRVILWALMQKDVIVIPKTTHHSRMEEDFGVFDFELHVEDLAAFAALDDGNLSRIFDHYDPKAVTWMLRGYVENSQLGGGTLYWERRSIHTVCADTQGTRSRDGRYRGSRHPRSRHELPPGLGHAAH